MRDASKRIGELATEGYLSGELNVLCEDEQGNEHEFSGWVL